MKTKPLTRKSVIIDVYCIGNNTQNNFTTEWFEKHGVVRVDDLKKALHGFLNQIEGWKNSLWVKQNPDEYDRGFRSACAEIQNILCEWVNLER